MIKGFYRENGREWGKMVKISQLPKRLPPTTLTARAKIESLHEQITYLCKYHLVIHNHIFKTHLKPSTMAKHLN